MKNIAIAIIGLVVFTACSKDRTCECTSTSTGSDRTVAKDSGGNQLSDGTTTYSNSGTSTYSIKATKKEMYRGNNYGSPCVSTEQPDDQVSSFTQSGITVTTTRTGTTTTNCSLKK